MKKILLSLACLLGYSRLMAAGAPPVQDVGSVDFSTHVAISVSTNPRVMLSTGTNNRCVDTALGGGGFFGEISTTSVPGQYLCGRIYLEIRNDNPVPIWIGNSANVSTSAGANYGIKIDSLTARVDFDSWPLWYAVSSIQTSTQVVIIQKR